MHRIIAITSLAICALAVPVPSAAQSDESLTVGGPTAVLTHVPFTLRFTAPDAAEPLEYRVVRVRDGSTRPVQVVSIDDAAAALHLAALEPLDGVYNVAADSWLTAGDAAALVGNRGRPELPPEVALRSLSALWSTGLSDTPPSALPYLQHSFVVANDRLKAAGWEARHTNEEAILLSSEQPESSAVGWIAASAAIVGGAVAATIWMRARRRRA